VSKDQPDADEAEKGSGDHLGEETPSRRRGDIRGHEAEKAQIPAEMIDDHRHDGDATRDIDQREAGARRAMRLGW